MKDVDRACGKCRWFCDVYGDALSGGCYGECRANFPVICFVPSDESNVAPHHFGYWPMVNIEQGCRHFVDRDAKPGRTDYQGTKKEEK